MRTLDTPSSDAHTPATPQGAPYRLAYLTSFHEIFGKSGQEFVGHNLEGLGYRMGNLEALIRMVNDSRQQLSGLLEVVAVVHDDSERKMRRMGLDASQPYREGNWPWPHDLPAADGRPIHEVTNRIPLYTGDWRRARKAGRDEEADKIRAAREAEMARFLDEMDVDLVLTDSLTYIFQHGMAMLEHFRGRILNFHPAFLNNDRGTAIPGLYPTESALMRMREGQIRGEGGQIIEVPSLKGYNRHGATLHQTVAQIDAGPIIFADENVEIRPEDTQQTLRHRVFEAGHEVLRIGLERFLSREQMLHNLNEARHERARRMAGIS